jgi:hypothetical protein
MEDIKLSSIPKSKTIDFNVLMPLVLWGADYYGFEIPPEAMVGIMALGNIALRFLTKLPIFAK